MNPAFTRTPTGMVGSRYFYPEPIVWVEGPTDIYFYEPVLGMKRCVVKPYHGRKNADALIRGLTTNATEYPYAVIVDGDYEILTQRRRSPHRWVITLERYSIENYLWERETLNRSCLVHACEGSKSDAIGALFEDAERELNSKLRELIELDIAAQRTNPSPEVLPARVDTLLVDPTRHELCPSRVGAIVTKAKSQIDPALTAQARADLDRFLAQRKLAYIVNGHVLLGIIQRVFSKTAARIRKKKALLSNDALLQLLSSMSWRIPSDDHRRLKTKLLRIVREINR